MLPGAHSSVHHKDTEFIEHYVRTQTHNNTFTHTHEETQYFATDLAATSNTNEQTHSDCSHTDSQHHSHTRTTRRITSLPIWPRRHTRTNKRIQTTHTHRLTQTFSQENTYNPTTHTNTHTNSFTHEQRDAIVRYRFGREVTKTNERTQSAHTHILI